MSHRQVKTPRELSVSTGSQGRQVTTGGSSNVNEGTNMSLSERFAMIHKRQKEQKKSSGTPKKNITTKAKSPATKENNGIKKRGKGDEKRKTGTPSSDKKTKKAPQSSEKKANKKAQQSSQPRVEKKAQKSEADLDKDLDVYFKNESK